MPMLTCMDCDVEFSINNHILYQWQMQKIHFGGASGMWPNGSNGTLETFLIYIVRGPLRSATVYLELQEIKYINHKVCSLILNLDRAYEIKCVNNYL